MSSIHTLNSKGEFPLYVNPFDCSCHTCSAYIGEEEVKEYPCLIGAGAGADYRGPDYRERVSRAATAATVAVTASKTGGAGTGPVYRPPAYGDPVEETTPTNSLPPPPAVPLVRVNAFATAGGALPALRREEIDLTKQLRHYRLTLMNEREDVYSMTPHSDDEANAQTSAWDILTEKIRATDALLAALRS